jgi:hypothetical protein
VIEIIGTTIVLAVLGGCALWLAHGAYTGHSGASGSQIARVVTSPGGCENFRATQ